jgi:hypothetical protein
MGNGTRTERFNSEFWDRRAVVRCDAQPPLRALNEAEESVAVARRAWTQQDLRDVKATTLVMSGVSAIMYPFTKQQPSPRGQPAAEAVLTGVSPVVPWVSVLT